MLSNFFLCKLDTFQFSLYIHLIIIREKCYRVGQGTIIQFDTEKLYCENQTDYNTTNTT